MLKRIALTAVFVATAAFVGVGVAKAHSGAARKASTPSIGAPQGFPGSAIVKPTPPQGFGCKPGGGPC